MKRSEAISIIANVLYECGEFHDVATEKADKLLKQLCDLGMLPPAVVCYTDTDSGRTLVTEECKWEAE